MTTEIKRLIRVRTEKGAEFKRDGFGKKRQLSDSWRKPRGQHNKQREQKKAKGALPKPGFGSPVAVRGMHPSGFFEALVFSLHDLEGLDPATQAVRISATVGTRKRIALQEKAISSGLKVLNARVMKKLAVAEEAPEDVTEPEKEAKSEKADVAEEPLEKSKKRKEPKKPAKSTPVTEPKSAKKPKEKAEEKAEKPPEKSAGKEPAKLAKKPAKTQQKEVAAPKEEKEETKPKAATKAKPKSKKATASGVKKNE
jgi:large subunit ribosomal protein L32e